MNINSIDLNALTEDQLLQLNQRIVSLVNARRKSKVDAKKRQLCVGDVVRFPINRGGATQTGVVTKIMRTRCHVEVAGGPTYRCYISGLELV